MILDAIEESLGCISNFMLRSVNERLKLHNNEGSLTDCSGEGI